jgi:hypothetical protein
MAIAQQQPDISYHPDFQKYQIRTESLKAHRASEPKIPGLFPVQLTGPLVWEGKDFTDEREWTFSLDESQLNEIRNALAYFTCELQNITR